MVAVATPPNCGQRFKDRFPQWRGHWENVTEIDDDSELVIIVPNQRNRQVKLRVYTCRVAKAVAYTSHLHAEHREGMPDDLKIRCK